MKSLKTLLTLIIITTASSAFAGDMYDGSNPKTDESAIGVCQSKGGEYLGSVALIKSDNGELHPEGPNADDVEMNFQKLASSLEANGSQVEKKFGTSEEWEWLESRFMCLDQAKGELTFVLRALSLKGFLKTYELTYIYNSNSIVVDVNGDIDVSALQVTSQKRVGWVIDGPFTTSIDEGFVKSVVDVALDNITVAPPEVQQP